MPTDRIRHMLDCLVTRNALAYQYFIEALILTGNVHIANILEPDYSTSEQCRRLIEREMIPHRQHVISSIDPNTSTAATTTTTTTTQAANIESIISSDDHNLKYPITCSQNHPHIEQLATWYSSSMHASYPNPLTLAALVAASTNSEQHHRRPPLHPNHHLAMRRQPTYSPMSTSRSNSTTG